ncbi:MAG: hypothetical protein LKE28_01960 [Sphaerochaeta sp.]|nr:hypothetical protein [Sphaerochaeta sp.]
MKKKFVLVLALVLMAAVAVTAAPVTLTGSFKAGYKFAFPGITAVNASTEISIDGLSIADDFWKVSVGSGPLDFGNKIGGKLSIYLDKALAANGVDMGDVTATFDIGNSTTMDGLTVYSDPNSTSLKLRMKGAYSSALTVGYSSLASAYVALDPTDATNHPFLVSAKIVPVEGMSVAAGYTNYAKNEFQSPASDDATGAVGGSVMIDIAKLAGLDFGLSASAQEVYFLGQKESDFLAAVSGSYADLSAYAEYQLFAGTSNVIAKVSYSGIKNASMYAKLTLKDLSNIATTIEAGANYKMGGVTYALDGSYDVKGEAFSLTPSVEVTF